MSKAQELADKLWTDGWTQPTPEVLQQAREELRRLEAANKELLELLTRYYNETPLGHQPHMIAHLAGAALKKHGGGAT